MRIHASSGTGGKPTIVGYTAGDLELWAEVMARCMAMAGVRPGMLVHNANGYGLFTGGLGFHHGAERLGATILPVSTGQTKRQAHAAARPAGARCCAARPSYAVDDRRGARGRGDRAGRRSSLEVGLFGAEPWSEPMRDAARAPARPARAQLLRAVGDHRARRRRRVRGGRRRAPDRGPLPRRGGRRRARHHHADQGGAAADPLPHRRHRDRRPRRRARAGARSRAWARCAAAATTC